MPKGRKDEDDVGRGAKARAQKAAAAADKEAVSKKETLDSMYSLYLK